MLHVEEDLDLHRVIRAMAGARAMLAMGRYDLVLLDLTLPDGSGWELLPVIREMKPAPRVIILSGAELSRAEAGKVEAALLKSHVSPRALLDALNTRLLKTKESSK